MERYSASHVRLFCVHLCSAPSRHAFRMQACMTMLPPSGISTTIRTTTLWP